MLDPKDVLRMSWSTYMLRTLGYPVFVRTMLPPVLGGTRHVLCMRPCWDAGIWCTCSDKFIHLDVAWRHMYLDKFIWIIWIVYLWIVYLDYLDNFMNLDVAWIWMSLVGTCIWMVSPLPCPSLSTSSSTLLTCVYPLASQTKSSIQSQLASLPALKHVAPHSSLPGAN